MAVNSTEESTGVHCVVALPDGGTTNTQHISLQKVPSFMKSDMSLNTDPNLQNSSSPKMDKASNYVPCMLDVDIENGNAEGPKAKEDLVGNLKSDDPLARAICLQVGGRFMQLLMNHGPELPKFASREKLLPERTYETPANRSRKYKRSTSFKSLNSRRIVILFSVLSSMGTIILIYLTLRVRQIADGSANA